MFEIQVEGKKEKNNVSVCDTIRKRTLRHVRYVLLRRNFYTIA